MHVAHFHPPRALAATIIAAVLAILVTLAVATTVNDTTSATGVPASGAPAVSRLVPTPPFAAHSTSPRPASTPTAVLNPFSPLIGSPITYSWTTAPGR